MQPAESKGMYIVEFQSDDPSVQRLSDLGDSWELTQNCETCGRLLAFNRHNVNVPVTCKCGQVFCLKISSKLL